MAYRVEPLLNDAFDRIPPVRLPHWNGGRRMHVILREKYDRGVWPLLPDVRGLVLGLAERYFSLPPLHWPSALPFPSLSSLPRIDFGYLRNLVMPYDAVPSAPNAADGQSVDRAPTDEQQKSTTLPASDAAGVQRPASPSAPTTTAAATTRSTKRPASSLSRRRKRESRPQHQGHGTASVSDALTPPPADLLSDAEDSRRCSPCDELTSPASPTSPESMLSASPEQCHDTDGITDPSADDAPSRARSRLPGNTPRLDFVLQEAPIEVSSEYLFSGMSHSSYWAVRIMLRAAVAAAAPAPLMANRRRAEPRRDALSRGTPARAGRRAGAAGAQAVSGHRRTPRCTGQYRLGARRATGAPRDGRRSVGGDWFARCISTCLRQWCRRPRG